MEVTDGKQFAAYMRNVRRRTLDVLEKVPIERGSWRLSPESMSIVDIVLHIAAVEKALWGSDQKQGKPGALEQFDPDSLNLPEAIAHMARVRKESVEFWSALTSHRLQDNIVTPTGDTMQLKRWLVLAAEHEIHHRSFIHAYRKIWGLGTSPIYGLTLDQLQKLIGTEKATSPGSR